MARRHEWAEGGRSRFGFYLDHPANKGPYCTTSMEGIGPTIVALRESGELEEGKPFGVLDGFGELGWVVMPFAAW